MGTSVSWFRSYDFLVVGPRLCYLSAPHVVLDRDSFRFPSFYLQSEVDLISSQSAS